MWIPVLEQLDDVPTDSSEILPEINVDVMTELASPIDWTLLDPLSPPGLPLTFLLLAQFTGSEFLDGRG